MRKVWDERHKYFRILAVHYLRVEIHASLGAFPGSLSPQGPDLQWSMVRFSYEITATFKNEVQNVHGTRKRLVRVCKNFFPALA